MDPFVINNRTFRSRLLLGSARFPDMQTMRSAIDASGAEIVTVAIRRMNLLDKKQASIPHHLDLSRHFLLPNTAGCYTAREAILTAQLAREALETAWIKLEIIGDDKTLYPDTVELLSAAAALVKDGFVVLPYCTDDPIVCRKLQDLGCAAIMPLAAPIGSGLGLCNPYTLALLRDLIHLPLIVDAGIGTASDATLAMELGMDALLVNTAIAHAKKPVQMALAMRQAVEAGRNAHLAGRIPRKLYGAASSPLEGKIACAPF